MKISKLAFALAITIIFSYVVPSTSLAQSNVFSESPAEQADGRSRQQIALIRQKMAYYRGAILDYDLLSRGTQVPQNVLEAVAEMHGGNTEDRNQYVIMFAEEVGQRLSEGNGVKESVYAVMDGDPEIAGEILRRAIDRVKVNSDAPTIRINADASGHFLAPAKLNGSATNMIVDTGATGILLSRSDAALAGVDLAGLKFDQPVQTAVGERLLARSTVESLEVFGVSFHGVEVLVSRPGDANSHSLLGMSILRRMKSVGFSGSQLVIVP